MFTARALGVLFLVLSLYYLWFFVLRQEPFTIVQMATLLCAGGFLLIQDRPQSPGAIWFEGVRPVAWQGWIAVLGSVVMLLAVFLVLDHDSHSVSDTLQRIVPTYSLVAALTLKLWYARTRRPAR